MRGGWVRFKFQLTCPLLPSLAARHTHSTVRYGSNSIIHSQNAVGRRRTKCFSCIFVVDVDSFLIADSLPRSLCFRRKKLPTLYERTMADSHSFFPPSSQSHRLLEDADAIPPNDSEVLKNTFMVYGSALGFIFLLFCYVRQRFPRPYTLRSWVEDLKVHTIHNWQR